MKRFLSLILAMCFTGSVLAEPARWISAIKVDDFDDSRTFTSSIIAPKQGYLTVRYHESTPSDYEVFWGFSGIMMMTCGDAGNWGEHSGWRNIQIRIDGGEVLSLTGTSSTNKKAAFLEDGSLHSVELLIRSLKSAKKLVIRTKDKCHENGQSWLFSKFEGIMGSNHLNGIRF